MMKKTEKIAISVILIIIILATTIASINGWNLVTVGVAAAIVTALASFIYTLAKHKALKQIIIIPIVFLICSFGLVNITSVLLLVPATVSKITDNTSIANDNQYTKLYQYKDKVYYTDTAFSQLIEVSGSGIFTNVKINNMYPGSYFSNNELDPCTLYFDLSLNTDVDILTSDRIDFALFDGINDNSVLIRIIDSKSGGIYYSYMTPENPRDFIETASVYSYQYKIGQVDLYMSLPSINGMISSDNDVSVPNLNDTVVSAILVTNQCFQCIPVTFADFGSTETTALNRINYYLNKDKIDTGVTELVPYLTELVNEIDKSQGEDTVIVRLYRACTQDEYTSGEKTPDQLNIIEIYDNGQYIYGKLDARMSDFFE